MATYHSQGGLEPVRNPCRAHVSLVQIWFYHSTVNFKDSLVFKVPVLLIKTLNQSCINEINHKVYLNFRANSLLSIVTL